MSRMKQKYLEEYEKYKYIKIENQIYTLKSNELILYEVVDISEREERATVRSVASGMERERTLHWCRKNLLPLEK